MLKEKRFPVPFVCLGSRQKGEKINCSLRRRRGERGPVHDGGLRGRPRGLVRPGGGGLLLHEEVGVATTPRRGPPQRMPCQRVAFVLTDVVSPPMCFPLFCRKEEENPL